MNQFRAAFASLFVLTVFFISLSPRGGQAQTGPAGVGNAEGTVNQPRNVLWLRADQGAQDTGGQLLQWNDQSGNSNHATPDGSPPAFSESVIVGQPAATFGGSDFLTISDDASLDGSGEATHFVVLRAEERESKIISKRDASSTVSYELAFDKSCFTIFVFEYCSNYFRYSVGSDATRIEDSAGGLDFGDAQVISARSNGSGGKIFRNGQEFAQGALPAVSNTTGPLAIGARSDGSDGYEGDIAEVITYDVALNTTRRIIVENYLAAKYGVTFLSNDVYSSSQYTQDVFGVGRSGTSDSHQTAERAGIRLESKTGLNDGDYLLAGHNVAKNSLDSSDVGGLGPHPARSSRVWFVDKTDSGNGLVVDVTFDLSRMGLSGQATSTQDYALIESSSSGSFSWSKVRQEADAVGNSDQITFRDVSLTDGHYYTIMTEDQTQSELDSRALVIRGLEGNEVSGSVNGGAGGDAGWRMLGVPVSGAAAGDLQSEVDSQLLEFWMRMMYGWDAGQGVWDPLQQASDPLLNGRGYVLYLFDNEQARFEPIDPTLTIDVNGGSDVTSGAVTVGDGTPAGDEPLDPDSTWHLLANPYVQGYNVDSLNLEVDGDGDGPDFQGTVQIWDPSVESYILRNNLPFQPSNGVVAPWQAFFVERSDFGSGAATQLTFSDAGTTTGGSFIGSKSASQSYRHLGLRVIARNKSGSEIARDGAASLLFHPGASTDKDFYDASKLEPFATSYVALAPTSTGPKGEKVLRAQRSLPYSLNEPMTIPLDFHMKNLDPSKVAISTSEWRGIPGSWAVTLVDTKGTTDTSDDVELSWGSDSTYTFAPASPKNRAAGPKAGAVSERSEDGTPRPDIRTLPHSLATTSRSKATSSSDTTRFVLKVDPSGQPLPVEMATFDAKSDGEELVLRWRTASETNNAGFYVQHQRLPADDSTATPSPEGWTRKAFVDGGGTTDSPQSYRHRLSGLEYGRHVFRLRQVDHDGDVTLSEVVEAEVRLKSDHEVSAPYPNPVRQQASVDVAVRESQPVRVTMYDVLGRRLRTVYDEELAAQRTKTIRIGVQDLASGVYFVRVQGDGFTKTTRMTVVR